MTVLECSTGNAGIGCSFVAAVKGYPCIIVMPEGMSEERKKIDIAYGSEMVYTPGAESDVDLALEKLEEIRAKDPDKYYVPAQFDNPDNVMAHYKTTGPEIWEQSSGKVTHFCSLVGSSGTLIGTAKALKERNASVKTFAVEPASAQVLAGKAVESTHHKIQGGGYALVPGIYDTSLVDDTIPVTDAYSTCCAIQNIWLAARAEGIGVGWVSIYEPEVLRAVLGIPDSIQIIGYFCIGYTESFTPEPELELAGWRKRLPLSELVSENRWGRPPPESLKGILEKTPDRHPLPPEDSP